MDKSLVDRIHLEEKRKERAIDLALGEGIKYGIFGSSLLGFGTLLATRRSPWFAKYISLSAKASFPVMAGLFLFSVKYELTLVSAQRNPEKWGLSDSIIEKGIVSRIPYHHQLMNSIYDHPFVMVASLSTPFAGAVIYKQLHLPHLTLSQRLMHSRVFAQGGVIAIMLTTMAFREYMEKRGRFPEPTRV